MTRSSTPRVRYHVLLYVILAMVVAGCGSGDAEGDRTTALRKSELLQPGESGTLDARACRVLSPAVVARASDAGGEDLSARPNNSLDLTICEWHGGPVSSVKLLVDPRHPTARGLRPRQES
jgi:hypothetical protein